MKTNRLSIAVLLSLFSCSILLGQSASKSTPADALNFSMKTLKGEEIALSKYSGKVVLFVNVASKCGLTPQYEQLQELHEKYNAKGLEIVGVPCNQFGKQEPGTAEEIAEFCQENYGVQFDMMSKVDVNGDDQAPLYKHLTSINLEPAGQGPIKWNFAKFVVDRSGKPIARYAPRTKPTDKEFISTIEKALANEGSGGVAGGGVPYSHKSSKSGKTYYLFSKDVPLKNSDKVQTIYYFAKDPKNPKGKPLTQVPEDRVVSETKTGMLVLKKKK